MLCAAASVAWALAWLGDIDFARPAMCLLALLLACCAVLGWASMASFGLPFALIFLAVPMWQPVSVLLQNLATLMVGRLLLLAHVPTFIDGNLIHISAGTIEVETGCSGLGFLLVSCTMAGYMALRFRPSAGTVAVALGAAALLGIAANWLRIFAIVLIAHYGGMDQPIVHNHIWFGWVIYTSLMVPALWIAVRTLESRAEPGSAPVGRAGRVGRGYLLGVLIVAALPPVVGRSLERLAGPGPDTVVSIPDRIEALDANGQNVVWTRTAEGTPEMMWHPQFPAADEISAASYADETDGRELQVLTARYVRQGPGHEVVGSGNALATAPWRRAGSSIRKLTTGSNAYAVSEQRFRNDVGEWLCTWSWYRVGAGQAATPVGTKIEEVRQKILGRSDAAIIAVAARASGPSCQDARPALASLSRHWLLPGRAADGTQ